MEGEVSVCALTRVHTHTHPKSVILQRSECGFQLCVPDLTIQFEAQRSTFISLLEIRAENL